jgi:hypothetical protein
MMSGNDGCNDIKTVSGGLPDKEALERAGVRAATGFSLPDAAADANVWISQWIPVPAFPRRFQPAPLLVGLSPDGGRPVICLYTREKW